MNKLIIKGLALFTITFLVGVLSSWKAGTLIAEGIKQTKN